MDENKKDNTEEKQEQTSSYKGPENPTLEYFPQMLQTSVVLIVDHNVTRFHTYDLFKRILLEEDHFVRILKKRPEVKDFILLRNDTVGRLRWAYTHFNMEFLNDVFGSRDHYTELLSQYLPDERMQCTPTTFTNSIENIFGNKNICGAILRQQGDKRPGENIDDFQPTPNFRTFLTSNILDARSLIDFVNKNGFNAVVTDSVQLVATMSYETSGVTYMFGTYPFNFDKNGALMGKEHLTLSELNNKNEFGIYYPYHFPAEKKKEENKNEP